MKKTTAIFTFLLFFFGAIKMFGTENAIDIPNRDTEEHLKFIRSLPSYQDILVGGQVIQKGQHICPSRFELIRPILDQYKRKFSVLDIGAMEGYFSFRIAQEYDAICTMIEGGKTEDKSKLYWYAQDKLHALCLLNSHLDNIDYLGHQLTLPSLQRLNQTEHFDVVLVFLVLHFMAQDETGRIKLDHLRKYIDTLIELGNDVIIEMSVDVYPELDRYVHRLCAEKGGQYLGELPRVWTDPVKFRGRFYWFKNPKKQVEREATSISAETFVEFNGLYPQ